MKIIGIACYLNNAEVHWFFYYFEVVRDSKSFEINRPQEGACICLQGLKSRNNWRNEGDKKKK